MITSFSQRYGRHKPDASEVHKSIRLRLKTCRPDEIRSAYDLALIVMDECSKILFNRQKVSVNQPQALDIIGTAIGNMVCGFALGQETCTGLIIELFSP